MCSGARRALVACASAVCLTTVAPAAGARLAAAPAPLFTLDMLLTVSPELPDVSRQVLLGEATRIWARERVALRWPPARGGTTRPDAPLRVLVVARADAAVVEDGRWAVAELVPFTDGRGLAIASIGSARRVVAAAGTREILEPPGTGDHRLGLVLGRAVAHEIGHFLLATGTHADRGLMRATIQAGEFAALRGEAFDLDTDASAWLRARLPDGLPAADQARTASFSYGVR
jgi:hypothetical protein